MSEPTKVLPPTPRVSKAILENIKKVAVTMPGEQALFLELDQNRPLAAIVQDICAKWTLATPEDHALQFSEPNRRYITERNRNEIVNGNVLNLTHSPLKSAQDIIDKLRGNKTEERLESLKQLSVYSVDSTFAMEFINKQGHLLIMKFVINGMFHGDPLAYTLKAFVALMDHNVVSWDVLEPEFTKKIAECVAKAGSGRQSNMCTQAALEILESVVLHSSTKHSVIEQNVTPDKILPHLQSTNAEVQKNGIALINALFLKADPERRKEIVDNLQSKSIRGIILNHVIGGRSVGAEMAHQLYVLQTLMLNFNEERLATPADPHDQNVMKGIEELRRLAFDLETDPNNPGARKSTMARDFKRLGFQNQTNPVQDFTQTPPGLLALDIMLHFAQNHGESYVKVVLENSSRADEHDCPFVQASIRLTKILAEILKIGEPPREEGQIYYPMFFCHDRPFEEFFSICIQLLNKTWREMRASAEDFQKVLSVVKEQITRALDGQQSTFDAFRTKLNQLTYAEIIKLWEMERQSKEEWESQAPPIVELRNRITPEVMDLIKQQRLNFLIDGTRFAKYSTNKRQKDKFWYWRLSPNHKALHFGDCGESETPSLEQLTNKLPIVDIKTLQTGNECQHVKGGRGRTNINANLAFTIVQDRDGPESTEHCFVAYSEQEFDMWIDGISALIGNQMNSNLTNTDLETLLSMEIKLRLLDTEGITIPTQAPVIPPEPANYNFAYTNL